VRTLNQQALKEGKTSRKTSYLLILIFAAPMIGAWILFNYFPDFILSFGTTNHGEFAKPYPKMETRGFKTLDGKPVAADYLKGKWTILYVAGENCDKNCQLDIFKGMQIRKTQGPEIKRVQNVLILHSATLSSEMQEFLSKQKELNVITADKADMDSFLSRLRLDHKTPFAARRVYLVDPLTTLMLFYEFDHADKTLKEETGMRKDLKKLLKNSKIG
jgi:hypothetical protein